MSTGSESGDKLVIRQAFRRLEKEVPARLAHLIRKLRHPDARWIRIPVGILLCIGGILSILPVLGIWMLPLGLLLIAYDVPFLRRPVGRFTIWAMQKWVAFRSRWQPKATSSPESDQAVIPQRPESGARNRPPGP